MFCYNYEYFLIYLYKFRVFRESKFIYDRLVNYTSMTDTPVCTTSCKGLVTTSIVLAILALACAVTILIISIFKFGLGILPIRIMWWVAFAVMVANLIVSMIVSKRNIQNKKMTLISMFLGLITAIILIVALFMPK